MGFKYLVIAILLIVAELVFLRLAKRYHIVEPCTPRSSHQQDMLTGGGVIFPLAIGLYALFFGLQYSWFMLGLLLVCIVSFWDDVHPLSGGLRLVVQFVATVLMFGSIVIGFDWLMSMAWYWQVLIAAVALFFCVGATNIINFLDGINGITAAYALAMLVPLLLVDGAFAGQVRDGGVGFIEPSYLVVAIIGVLVFSIFNFRPKGKAKCFAGDVGSIGIAFIILFALGRLMLATKDVTWIVLFLVYGIDGSLTIFHRIMLHENLGQAHRKHAYQLMANELKMSHVTVSCIYMVLQLIISLGFIYLCPNTILAHWVYLIGAGVVLAIGYILFMRKYYYLHEQYLKSLEK